MTETLEVSLFIFVLASFLGYAVITRVPGLLHTPLMSLTNALSAISIVGSLILAGAGEAAFATILGTIAVFASTTTFMKPAVSLRSNARPTSSMKYFPTSTFRPDSRASRSLIPQRPSGGSM